MTARIPIGYITKVRIINETTKLFCKIILNLFSYKIRIYGIVLLHLYCLIIKNKKVMKNLHIIPTDKPSRLCNVICTEKSTLTLFEDEMDKGKRFFPEHIYITSDEEIKEGDWGLSKLNEIIKFHSGYDYRYYSKIILTTDQDLDGVQAIDDEFLEWFVKNPSCEEAEVFQEKHHFGEVVDESYPKGFFDYKIVIPTKEHKQETHICKYCKSETTQSDDECYAKPKQE